jgi:tRNA-splicing ligase RtcB
MLRTNLLESQLTAEMKESLCDALFATIPVGVGCRGTMDLGNKPALVDAMCETGMNWALEQNLAWPEDLAVTERQGCMPGAVAKKTSKKAKGRANQLGTLGSGNHYVEVQAVEEIYDQAAAECMGIKQVGQLCVMIHCGSRGFGHQVASDFVNIMTEKGNPQQLNDPQLVCMPIGSLEGQNYLAAMASAANFAFVNRSAIAMLVRAAFEGVFGKSARDLDMHQVYDVAHNIASLEEHELADGRMGTVLVHRKGSTRAFPPGHPELPAAYQQCGQPVLIGGSMGTCSYVMTGQPGAMKSSFGSTCHGAGRAMSRNCCKRTLPAEAVLKSLADKNISIRVASPDLISEEAPESYKDVIEVVEVCHVMGLSKKAFKLRPIAVIKG